MLPPDPLPGHTALHRLQAMCRANEIEPDVLTDPAGSGTPELGKRCRRKAAGVGDGLEHEESHLAGVRVVAVGLIFEAHSPSEDRSAHRVGSTSCTRALTLVGKGPRFAG